MTLQELATVIIATVGANSIVFIGVWKLSEKMIDQKLNKAHSLFSSRKQIFCERQEEAFAHTYSLLMECNRELFYLGETNNLAEYKTAKTGYETVYNGASLYFLAKCFYFTPNLIEAIQKLLLLYNDIETLYSRGHNLEHHGAQYLIDMDTLKDTKAEVDALLKRTRDLLYKTLSTDDQ